ncbi:MAG: transglutaminase domain-containing protein [Candidatus Bathyarchaeota archaeon]|nr:transglutaminase domain-containing protein [Candidatus Bathyarchaeota archaeon]
MYGLRNCIRSLSLTYLLLISIVIESYIPSNPGLRYIEYRVYEVEDVATLTYLGSNRTVYVDWLVPLNNSHQLSYVLELNPKVYDRFTDRWGNVIYRFKIDLDVYGSTFRLEGRYRVVCYSTVSAVDTGGYGRLEDIDLDRIDSVYLAPSYWWNFTDPIVSRLLEEIKSSLIGDSRIDVLIGEAKKIVNSKLSYRRIEERLGASEALRRGYGDCSEFSDLLISLARGLGIPARRVLGVYIEDSEVKGWHAWVEVWSPPFGWIPIEATDPLPPIKPLGHITSNYLALYVEGYQEDTVDEEFRDEEILFDVKLIEHTRLVEDPYVRVARDLAISVSIAVVAIVAIHIAVKMRRAKG